MRHKFSQILAEILPKLKNEILEQKQLFYFIVKSFAKFDRYIARF